jgi:hypothetical protein
LFSESSDEGGIFGAASGIPSFSSSFFHFASPFSFSPKNQIPEKEFSEAMIPTVIFSELLKKRPKKKRRSRRVPNLPKERRRPRAKTPRRIFSKKMP